MLSRFVGGEDVDRNDGKEEQAGGGKDPIDESVLQVTENRLYNILVNGPTTSNYDSSKQDMNECMYVRENLKNLCQRSRFCKNSDAMRLSVAEMCLEYEGLSEMSKRAGEQFFVILGVCFLCFVLYMVLLLVERITGHFFGKKKESNE